MMIRRRHILPFIIALCLLIYSMITVPGCDRLVTDHHVDTVLGHPYAGFTVNDSIGCDPMTVTFTDTTVGNHDKWTWYFGDGDSSNDAHPVHIYAAPGVYTVILKVENTPTDGADTEAKSHYIRAGTSVAGMILSDTVGCAGLEVSFKPGAFGLVDSFIWDFGDNCPPVVLFDDSTIYHTYDTSGSYDITLTAAGLCDTVILNSSSPILVSNCPIVGLESSDTAGCAPLDVVFSDLSTLIGPDSIIGWYWEFGDGDTSTDTNPAHTYVGPGEYTPILTVTTSDSSTATDSMTVPIEAWDRINKVDFAALSSPTGCKSIYQDFKVKFVDQSVGTVDSIKWYFGDGDSSVVSEPVHTYDTSGNYDVTLFAFGPCGVFYATKLQFVRLTDSLTTAHFTAAVDSETPYTYRFTDESPGTVLSRLWIFGADTVTTASSVIDHSFLDVGPFQVSLTSSNDCNKVQWDSTIVVDTTTPAP